MVHCIYFSMLVALRKAEDKQEMFVKHVCPPNDSLFDIQHWPDKMCILNGINLKINRGHLLVMSNLHTKFEDPSFNVTVTLTFDLEIQSSIEVIN